MLGDRRRRSRRAAPTGPTASRRPTRRRRSSATSAPPTARAARDQPADGRVRAPPVHGGLAGSRRRDPAPEEHDDHDRRLPEARHAPRARPSDGTAQRGAHAADHTTPSSASRPRVPVRKRRVVRRQRLARSPSDSVTLRRPRPRTTARALELAYCQPTVRGLFVFHTFDEAEPRRLAVRPLLRRRARRSRACRSSRATPSPTCAAAGFRPALARVPPWPASTSPTPSSRSIPPGGGCRSTSARPARTRSPRSSRTGPAGSASLRAYSIAGVRPDCDFFLWKITERYEDLGELGAALNATPLAGLARDAVLVPRDDEGLAVHEGAQAAARSCRRARRTSSSTRS